MSDQSGNVSNGEANRQAVTWCMLFIELSGCMLEYQPTIRPTPLSNKHVTMFVLRKAGKSNIRRRAVLHLTPKEKRSNIAVVISVKAK